MTWALTRVEPPQDQLISTADAKLHLRVDHDVEDTLIDRLVDAATEHCETVQHRAYLTQTLRLTLPRFPSQRVLFLPRPPLQEVQQIEYRDMTGALVELSNEHYRVDTDAEPGQVILNRDHTWPATAHEQDAVRITYVAGYGGSADVPSAERSAALLLVGHLYENREGATVATGPSFRLPMGVEYLLNPNRAVTRDPLGGA